MVRFPFARRPAGTMNPAGPAGSPAPSAAASGVHSNGCSHVTVWTQSAPSIRAPRRARSTRAAGSSDAPVAMTPRITPADRSTRVKARVSISAIATMPLRRR